jgi:hypothetical protein
MDTLGRQRFHPMRYTYSPQDKSPEKATCATPKRQAKDAAMSQLARMQR